MTKTDDKLSAPTEPKVERAPADPLLAVLESWCRQFSARAAAKRLRAALAAEGIDTPDALAAASVTTVAAALRAELRLDAQSLTGAAALAKESLHAHS